MKSVALIHTVKPVAMSFAQELRDFLGYDIKTYNLWDDFLANNPAEVGEFTIENKKRLYNDIQTQELTGADVIAVTCSTLTPTVKQIRPFIRTPLIAIDEAMAKEAAACGTKILVLATAESTKKPTMENLLDEGRKLGKKLDLDVRINGEAYDAMRAMDMKKHDGLLLNMAHDIRGYDCIVLAQASMAHLEQPMHEICGIPVFSSPRLCMEQIRSALEK